MLVRVSRYADDCRIPACDVTVAVVGSCDDDGVGYGTGMLII